MILMIQDGLRNTQIKCKKFHFKMKEIIRYLVKNTRNLKKGFIIINHRIKIDFPKTTFVEAKNEIV